MSTSDAEFSAQVASSPETGGRTDLAISALSRFNKELVDSMRSVAEIGERGPSNVLLGVGVAMIFVALFFKLRPAGLQISDLQASEFITLLVVAAALLVCASLLRIYQYRYEQEVNRSMREEGVKLIHETLTTGIDLSKTGKPGSPPGGL